jgi:alditol oxidase
VTGPLGRNWAGNHAYAAARLHRPGSVGELQELVAGARRLKAIGTRHCFNDVADFPGGELVSVAGLPAGIEIDRSRHSVTVGAATTYGELAPVLDAAGYALANLASLPHCSVAGSVATATHGSGERHRNLAAAVSAVELVAADGELRRYFRDRDPDFGGVVVALGALGVVTRLTLDLVPAFTVCQQVYEGLRWATAVEHFDELQAAGYSVSLFTGWAGETIDQVWVKTRLAGGSPPGSGRPPALPTVSPPGSGRPPSDLPPVPLRAPVPARLLGARPAGGPRHPVPGASAVHCTEQLGVPGPWYDRLPHFRLGFTPSSGAELQSEYFVPRRHAAAAFEAFRSLSGLVSPLLQVSEIRTVAADEQWLSPCYRTDCVAVHLTWQPRPAEVLAALPVIEDRLAPLAARPHWGKLFAGPLFAGYPRLPDFRRLMDQLDPTGTFRSPFLTRLLGPTTG